MLAFGLTYWIGARGYDFITPPDAYATADVEAVLASSPSDAGGEATTEPPVDEVASEPEPEPSLEPEPEVVGSHPSDYLDLQAEGVDAYIALAEKLVAEQKSEHSLVAWERVLDSAKADATQVKRAYDILKLHKANSPDNATGIAITVNLHASVPADLFEKMEKVLQHTATLIEMGSGYSLRVTPEVSVVAVKKGRPRPSVSIWLSGKSESPRGSFRTKHSKVLGLDEKVNTVIFNIVGPFLEQHTKLTPISEMHNEVNAQETLQYLITRHSWRQFGLLLYQDLEESAEE